MSQVAEHFDNLAAHYDQGKQRNWYYYDQLKKLYQGIIPKASRILDVGCGTGDILAFLGPKYGLGIDISSEMIKRAKAKYGGNPCLEFWSGGLAALFAKLKPLKFDFIILADVLEHLENPAQAIRFLAELSRTGTKLVISLASSRWEPVLLLLEKLKLKMPEGPHHRLSEKEIEKLFASCHFFVIRKGHRLLLPLFIPLLSPAINSSFYHLPLVKKLGLVVFWVCQRAEKKKERGF